MIDLVKKVESLTALHRAYEMVPESPWHPDHPTMKGKTPLSERPIAFLVNDEIKVIGDSVEKVIDGLTRFWNDYAPSLRDEAGTSPQIAAALLKVETVLTAARTDVLTFGQGTWNSILYALNMAHVDTILTDGTKP